VYSEKSGDKADGRKKTINEVGWPRAQAKGNTTRWKYGDQGAVVAKDPSVSNESHVSRSGTNLLQREHTHGPARHCDQNATGVSDLMAH